MSLTGAKEAIKFKAKQRANFLRTKRPLPATGRAQVTHGRAPRSLISWELQQPVKAPTCTNDPFVSIASLLRVWAAWKPKPLVSWPLHSTVSQETKHRISLATHHETNALKRMQYDAEGELRTGLGE